MWINFTNLNGTEVRDLLKGKEARECCHILCEPRSVILYQSEFNDTPGWVITVVSKVGHDPKLHFTDEGKAQECYQFLAKMIPGRNDDDYAEIDALVHGAL